MILENGARFEGDLLGSVEGLGELVFNTGMTGYQECFTDPSYEGQILTLTYPLIGNYGANDLFMQNRKPAAAGFVLDQIAELHKVRGITIILVSHSMEDIAKYAERLIVVNDGEIAYDDAPKAVFAHYRELEAMGLAAPQITYIMHALKEKGLDVDVTATTVDEAKENILAVLRKCNPGKLSGDKQSVSDSQSKKENAKAETLISEMEADLTEDGTKESHSDAPDEDLSIQKETMDKKSAEQEENKGGQEV